MGVLDAGEFEVDRAVYTRENKPRHTLAAAYIIRERNYLYESQRENALLKHNKEKKEVLPFVTQYQPSVSTLKEVLMEKWNLIQNQPLLRQIFKEPPIISYKKGKSLKDMLV